MKYKIEKKEIDENAEKKQDFSIKNIKSVFNRLKQSKKNNVDKK